MLEHSGDNTGEEGERDDGQGAEATGGGVKAGGCVGAVRVPEPEGGVGEGEQDEGEDEPAGVGKVGDGYNGDGGGIAHVPRDPEQPSRSYESPLSNARAVRSLSLPRVVKSVAVRVGW